MVDVDELLAYTSMIKMTSRIGHKLTHSEPDLSYVNPQVGGVTEAQQNCWAKLESECHQASDCYWRKSAGRSALREATTGNPDQLPYLCEHSEDVHFATEGDLVYHHNAYYRILRIVEHPPILPTVIFGSSTDVVVCFAGFDPYYDSNTPDEGFQYYCVQEFAPLKHGKVRLGVLNLFNFIRPTVNQQLLEVVQPQTRLTFSGFSFGGALARLLTYDWYIGDYGPPLSQPLRLRTFGEIPIGDTQWVQWWNAETRDLAARLAAGRCALDTLAIASAAQRHDQLILDALTLLPHQFEPVATQALDESGWVEIVPRELSELRDTYAPEDYDLCSFFAAWPRRVHPIRIPNGRPWQLCFQTKRYSSWLFVWASHF